MFTDNRPEEYASVMRPMMLNELIPAAASTTIVALIGMLVLTII
jgi:hypothetical protein